MSLSAIILAADSGAQIRSRRAKVLHELCGRAMLHYTLRAGREAGCDRLLVAVGPDSEELKAAFESDEHLTWVEQAGPAGVVRALRQCAVHLSAQPGDVLVLPGDMPLIRGESLRALVQAHRDERASATLGTAVLDDPDSCPGVARDESGEFAGLVADATEAPANDDGYEVFSGAWCCRSGDLLAALLEPEEQELSGLFDRLMRSGRRVAVVRALPPEDVLCIRTRQHLSEADAMLQERLQRRLREAGVTIVNPAATYVEDGVSVGLDTVIYPYTYVGRDSSIGADCVIGPFAALPRSSIVPAGATIAGNISPQTAMLAAPGYDV